MSDEEKDETPSLSTDDPQPGTPNTEIADEGTEEQPPPPPEESAKAAESDESETTDS